MNKALLCVVPPSVSSDRKEVGEDMAGYGFRMFLLVAIVIVQFAFFTCITSTQFGMFTECSLSEHSTRYSVLATVYWVLDTSSIHHLHTVLTGDEISISS